MSLYESASSRFQVVMNPEPPTEPPEIATAINTVDPSSEPSILSLTLDEIQMKISGKNFGSMNMDEFVANLWTVDEKDKNFEGKSMEITCPPPPQPVLARQGSLLSVPVPLCKKTVDEVWFEIQEGIRQKGDKVEPPAPQADHNNSGEEFHRQQTLGEITLEDFLVKAGVVQEPMTNSEFSLGVSCRKTDGMVGGCVNVNRSALSLYSDDQMINFSGESSSNHNVNLDEKGKSIMFLTDLDGFGIKKRIIDGPPEILLERRQRRMIKNRESAARSRARKQAYTVELELELNHLTEENLKLKKIVEENEKRRKQEVMRRNKEIIREKKGEKLRRIRRIVSTGW